MHSSQPGGIFVRNRSNSPADSRNPRGQDYNSWKSLQREQEFQAGYSAAMDIDYPPSAATAGNPGYPLQAQYSAATTASYPATSYPAQASAPAPAATPQFTTQPAAGYVYSSNPQVQYTAHPQTSAERYPVMPPSLSQYAQEPFVAGADFRTAAGGAYPHPPAGQNRMTPAIPQGSAAPPRTFTSPAQGTPAYGPDDPYGGFQPPAPKPSHPGFPTDGLYGRGGYPTAATTPPRTTSDDLGSSAGPTQRPGYASPSEQYDDQPAQAHQGATTPTGAVPVQVANGARPVRRGDRDSEPREQERDHRDHRTRRSEPEDRHSTRHRR
jgi:hypothetical protein